VLWEIIFFSFRHAPSVSAYLVLSDQRRDVHAWPVTLVV
jgi:hypothetical protein